MEIQQRQKLQKRKTRKELPLAFSSRNFLILGAGVLILLLGNIALAQMPVFGAMPLVVAPILLVLGYCVVVPVAIMYRKKDVSTPQDPQKQ